MLRAAIIDTQFLFNQGTIPLGPISSCTLTCYLFNVLDLFAHLSDQHFKSTDAAVGFRDDQNGRLHTERGRDAYIEVRSIHGQMLQRASIGAPTSRYTMIAVKRSALIISEPWCSQSATVLRPLTAASFSPFLRSLLALAKAVAAAVRRHVARSINRGAPLVAAPREFRTATAGALQG